jgi:hypothetical protein
MQWMMDAMERVKMSRDPKPKLRTLVTTNGEIISWAFFSSLFFRFFFLDTHRTDE